MAAGGGQDASWRMLMAHGCGWGRAPDRAFAAASDSCGRSRTAAAASSGCRKAGRCGSSVAGHPATAADNAPAAAAATLV